MIGKYIRDLPGIVPQRLGKKRSGLPGDLPHIGAEDDLSLFTKVYPKGFGLSRKDESWVCGGGGFLARGRDGKMTGALVDKNTLPIPRPQVHPHPTLRPPNGEGAGGIDEILTELTGGVGEKIGLGGFLENEKTGPHRPSV